MKSNKFTPQKIEEILQSIDGMSRAEVSPFFYTRLQGRLTQSSQSAQPFWLMVTRPAVSFATLSLLLVLNIVGINYFSKANQQTTTETSTGIQNFANEYNLSVSSMYNVNEIK